MDRAVVDVLKTPVIGQDEPNWASWSDEALLDLPMCDLQLGLTGGFLEQPIAELTRELEQRELLFRPHFWLSNEWFTPDGVPGIAIPFYLAHPRLAKLELTQMLEVEGGTREWCLRILRHETGHAIETPTSFVVARRVRTFSANHPNDTRGITPHVPTAEVSYATWIYGMRKATRTRTSPKPLPSG